MPLYTYKCEMCDHKFDTVHSITEELHNCENCNKENCLKKVPQILTSYSRQKTEKDLAGERIKRSIEDNRKLLLDQKENINRDYKP